MKFRLWLRGENCERENEIFSCLFSIFMWARDDKKFTNQKIQFRSCFITVEYSSEISCHIDIEHLWWLIFNFAQLGSFVICRSKMFVDVDEWTVVDWWFGMSSIFVVSHVSLSSEFLQYVAMLKFPLVWANLDTIRWESENFPCRVWKRAKSSN